MCGWNSSAPKPDRARRLCVCIGRSARSPRQSEQTNAIMQVLCALVRDYCCCWLAKLQLLPPSPPPRSTRRSRQRDACGSQFGGPPKSDAVYLSASDVVTGAAAKALAAKVLQINANTNALLSYLCDLIKSDQRSTWKLPDFAACKRS